MRRNHTADTDQRSADRNFVASLGKGLEVLTCFGRQHSRLTVSEAAALTGTTVASARRALLTLHQLEYLGYDGKHFWVQQKALLVAHAYLASRAAPSLAQPLLDALSERTRESASLAKLMEEDAIIIARSTARRSLATGLGIGSRLPLHSSSLGRVLLASLPAAETERRLSKAPLEKMTSRTITKPEMLLEMVNECRETGVAYSDGELELDVISMSVPVFDRTGATVAAMSIAVRSERMRLAEFRAAFLPILRRARDTLSTRLPAE